MKARLIAVGVGPGDPELLTIKGARLLGEADVVFTPVGDRSDSSIAESIVERYLDPSRQEIIRQVSPMNRDREALKSLWKEVAGDVARRIEAGKTVAFVTLGDPFLYSTFLHLYQALRADYPDCPIEVVPGVTSFTAGAALAGKPLGLYDDRMAVLPATVEDDVLLRVLADFETVVLMKVSHTFPRLRTLLNAAGRSADAVYIRRAGLPRELVCADLDAVTDDDLDYLSLVIVARN